MCGGTCGESTCDGTCISGNFWGLFYHDDEADDDNKQLQDVNIRTYASPADPSKTDTGCYQAGDVYNPDEIAFTEIPYSDPPALDMDLYPTGAHLPPIVSSNLGQCFPSPYAFCSPPGKIKFSGPDSIIGRSVSLRRNNSETGLPETTEQAQAACGTIGTDIFNPDMNVRLASTTDDGIGGSTCDPVE